MECIVFLLILVISGSLYSRSQKRASNTINPELQGFLCGILPILISALWALSLMLRYHRDYGSYGMGAMFGYSLSYYVAVPILILWFTNVHWKHANGALFYKQLTLTIAYIGGAALTMALPMSWNFTFLLLPFSLLFLILGFVFLRVLSRRVIK